MTRRVNEDATELSSIFQKMLLLGGCFKMEKNKMFTVYTNLLHMNFAFVLFCFSMGLPTNITEIDDFAFNLGSCLALGTIVLKIVITRCKKYQSLIRDIFEYEEYMTNLAPKSLKKKYYSSANRQTPILRYYALTFVFNIVAAIFIAGFFILRYRPESDHSRPIMIKIWLPLDPEKHYIAANFLCGLMVIIAGGLNITSDFTILYPVLNLIFRIKLLKHVLQHPEKFRGEYDDFRVMLQCVLEHENTIQKHKNLNNMMTYFFFCDFLLRALQIAGFIFIIIRNIVSLNNLLYFGCVAFLLFQLFILYWYGQILIDESQSISNAIYMSNWYCENVKSQRLILMIMLRSQRPLGLKIGPIGIVHLGICLKILKTIYTIITMYSEV